MKIHYILISIVIILAGLFVFVKFFRPKEQKNMELEALYAASLLALRNHMDNSQLLENCQKAALNYGKSIGKSDEESLAMMTKDITKN